MKRVCIVSIIAAAVSVPGTAAAQAAATSTGAHGHFFFYTAPAESPEGRRAHVGGGGEAALGRSFGVGTEVGAILDGPAAQSLTTLSVDAFVHPRGQHALNLDPYVTGGIAAWIADRHGRTAHVNLGAGLNWWFRERRGYNLGVGLELRRSLPASFTEMRVMLRLWQ